MNESSRTPPTDEATTPVPADRRNDAGRSARPTGGRGAIAFVVLLVVVGAVAYAIRLSIMVRGGGLHGLGAYDDGVYYAAADALVHGRLPYRDFLFIQPPLITVVAAPFAALGTIVSDPTGFALARLAFIGIGAVNAALVAAVLRRYGWSAAIIGGLGYAVFHPAVYSERSVLLEPLGTLGMLLAILLLQHAPAHRRLAVVAGIAGGLATGAKIWYIVPALLLLLLPGGRLRYLIGVAIGGCAIYLPFLFAAPQIMVQQVILDQIGRSGGTVVGTGSRLHDILGVRTTVGVPSDVILPVLAVLAVLAVLVTLATRGARILAVLAIAATAILLVSPSWFAHYTALTAPFLALCIGVAGGRLTGLLRGRWPKVAVVAVIVLGVVGTNEANDRTPYGVRVPAGLDLAADTVKGCVMADDQGTLIEMNILSRNLRDPSCDVWPDVTGWTYDPRDLARNAQGKLLDRRLNVRWQRDVVAYLRSGDSAIRTRSATGLSVASKAIIDAGPVLYRNHGYVVHATP